MKERADDPSSEKAGDAPAGSGVSSGGQFARLDSLLEAIVENIPIMLFVKDAEELRFQLFNRAGEELVGFSRSELLGKNDYDFFPLEQAKHFQEKDRQVLDAGKMIAVDEPLATPGGERLLHTKKIPLFDDDGVPRFLVGISEDVTDRRKFEDAERVRVITEARARAKSEFFANASHEIRTPLALVLGPLRALLANKYGAVPEEARDVLRGIERNASRMAALVDDVLDFTKIDAGKARVSLSRVEVGGVVRDLVADARPAASSRGLTLTCSVDDGLGVQIVDRALVEKITFNLVGNALKFTPRGGCVDVGVRSYRSGEPDDGGGVELVVTDTGVGIPEDKLAAIFERFEQADSSSTRAHEGTGLGLALVKQFVELMGGSVGVTSRPGEGSRFWVRLPKRDDAVVDDALATSTTARQSSTRPNAFDASVVELETGAEHVHPGDPVEGTRPYVLCAEDNADMRRFVVDTLRNDYEVLAVANGREALVAARERVPDVLLSDVMMPEVDGIALVRAFKSDDRLRHTAVVLLTARAGVDAMVEGLDAGADDYLVKPFEAAELGARLRAAVRLHAATRDLALTLEELHHAKRTLVSAESIHAMSRVADVTASALDGRAGDDSPAKRVVPYLHALRSLPAPRAARLTRARSLVDRFEDVATQHGARVIVHDTVPATEVVCSEDDVREALARIARALIDPQKPSELAVQIDGSGLTLRAGSANAKRAAERIAHMGVREDRLETFEDLDLVVARALLARGGVELTAESSPAGAIVRLRFGG